MPYLYLRSQHPDNELKVLTVKVDLEPQGAYSISGGRVVTLKADKIEEISREEFKSDEFSEALASHGFDEPEIRLEIEEAIDGLSSSESLL